MVKFLRLEPFSNRRWWFNYVVKSMKRQGRRGEQPYKLVKNICRIFSNNNKKFHDYHISIQYNDPFPCKLPGCEGFVPDFLGFLTFWFNLNEILGNFPSLR